MKTQRLLSREALRCYLKQRSACLVEPGLVAEIERRVLGDLERYAKWAVLGREEECRRRGRPPKPGGYLRKRHLDHVLGEAKQ